MQFNYLQFVYPLQFHLHLFLPPLLLHHHIVFLVLVEQAQFSCKIYFYMVNNEYYSLYYITLYYNYN